jgi:pyruvate ferredoxin oxidoreductase delta subunit
MKKDYKIIDESVTWKDITIGGLMHQPGNAEAFKTGDWRSMKPVWIRENCKQCLLCYPVCPDASIPVDKETGLRIDFDYDHCKGCGVCVKVCPFKAIDFVEEGK